MKHKALNALATEMVGDGKSGNLFFVTDQGNVVTVSGDFKVAYGHWKQLAARRPLIESALEDRHHGVIASVEPEDENGPGLVVFDDSYAMRKGLV